MSTLDGARVLNDREQSKIKAAEYQTGKATFKRK
jgi:hypothetical protein